MFSFENKGVLLIGGGQNIGRAIALEFARRGARLAVADLNADGARAVAGEIEAAGGQAIGLAVDVSNEDSLAACVAEAEGFLGAVDVLMNNAGILSGGNPEDIPVAAWQRMMDINFFGIIRANALVMPKMIERGSGYIVNTASFAGLYPFASSRVHYSASKAAIVAMSYNLAVYLLPKGVNVGCLCPGPVMTTSNQGMQHFTKEYTMRGPGAHLRVKSQEEVAELLADAMEAEKVMILTHPEGHDSMREYAADPDAYIRRTADDWAQGFTGLPGRPRRNALDRGKTTNSGPPQSAANNLQTAGANVATAVAGQEDVDAKRQRLRLGVGFLLAVPIAGVGVRTLDQLVTVHHSGPV